MILLATSYYIQAINVALCAQVWPTKVGMVHSHTPQQVQANCGSHPVRRL